MSHLCGGACRHSTKNEVCKNFTTVKGEVNIDLLIFVKPFSVTISQYRYNVIVLHKHLNRTYKLRARNVHANGVRRARKFVHGIDSSV